MKSFFIYKHFSNLFKNKHIKVCIILLLLLNVFFFPVLWGNKTLMSGARDAPSIMPGGAYGDVSPPRKFYRTPDPGAPAWQYEPSTKIIQNQYLNEKNAPLWNPFSAYGTPLTADMISQPFYPLTFLLSLCLTIQTYDLFIIFRLFLAGIFTYLFLRLFINTIPSLFASIAFMFTGYFIIYLNMQHLSVEILLPAVFYFFEILLRNNDSKRLACSSIIIFLIIAGGMPESAFLILSFGYLYYFFRVFTDLSLRPKKLIHIKNFILMNILGFTLSALFLLPFLEFMKYSFDMHQPSNRDVVAGIKHDTGFKSFLIYLIPMIFGGVYNSVFKDQIGIIGYWGVLPFLFAVLSVIAYFRLKRDQFFNTTNLLVIFFSLSATLMVMKRFGFYLINWIGYLPLSNMINYPKYQEPLLGFAVAVLAGIGFSVLSEEKLKQRHFISAVAVTAGIIFGLFACWLPVITQIQRHKIFILLNITSALFLIVFATAFYLIGRRSVKFRSWLPYIFIFVLSGELFCNFILPSFYAINKLPDKSFDPYKGAPYIDFLKENNHGHYRVFGRENVLYPNWSGVFGLYDIRQLNAMNVKKYMSFISSFLTEESGDKKFGATLPDRFTGGEKDYYFETLAERRLLQLSSVKYVLSISSYDSQSKNQDEPGPTPGFLRKVYDDEVKIHEVPDILPRASVFYQAELVEQDDRILSRLKDPSFNPKLSILVSSATLSDTEKNFISRINNFDFKNIDAAETSSFESQKVEIKADLSQPGILMLNDTCYPGWKAYVDGREAKILNVNYLFRGVLLEEGQHTVEFRYEPASFRLGLLTSTVSVAAIIALFLRKHPVR